MPDAPHSRWPRFTLRFILFWVMPYIAIAAAVTTWSGPYASEFLNGHARLTLLIGLTILWITLLASGAAKREP